MSRVLRILFEYWAKSRALIAQIGPGLLAPGLMGLQSSFVQNQISSPGMSGAKADQDHMSAEDAGSGLHDGRGVKATVAVAVAASGVLLALVASGSGQPLMITVMALLAMVGVFFLFAFAAGHVVIGERLPSEQIASALAQDFDDGLLLATPEGRAFWRNDAFDRLVGGIQGGELGALEIALSGGRGVAGGLFRLARAAERGDVHQEDLAVNLAAGHLGASEAVRCCRVSVRPYALARDTDEFGALVLWTVSDITNERAREHRQRAHLEDTLQRYESMPVGLVSVARDGRVRSYNATFGRWLGFDGQSAQVGRDLTLSGFVSSDSAQLIMGMMQRRRGGNTSLDIDLMREDGRVLPIRALCQPDKDADGGFVIAAWNREADESSTGLGRALADNTAMRFQSFFRSAPFGIATVGADGRVRTANAAFSRMIMDGTSGLNEPALEVLGRSVGDEDLLGTIKAGLERVVSGRGNVAPFDIWVGAKSEYARRVYMSPLTQSRGTDEAAVLYVIDVTEQKELEAKFAQSQKMDAVGKLAGFVAHDFNNMLTAIIGFSDFLLQTHRPTDPAYSDIINIKSSANRAAGLVGKLLALARQQTLVVESLQLGEVMTDLAPLLKRSIGEKIELKLSNGRDLWYVKTDKLQLEQAVINLAVNARDAMADGGRLSIRTRNISERESQRLQLPAMPVGEYVLIEVADTGTGMPPEVLKKIFEPFFTTKAVGKGTGLGLATVYGIVKQTGGFIFPESTPGEGTTFRVYLPRHHMEEAEAAALAEKVEAKQARQSADLTGTGRVLLVEDEDVVRSFAVRALTRQGYEVLVAEDGAEALEVMEAHDGGVDIVVSDVVMPGMDGPTMLKEMRKNHPDIKIIFVSGYPNEAFQQALGEEKFAFLPKPFSLPQLAAKVKEELGK